MNKATNTELINQVKQMANNIRPFTDNYVNEINQAMINHDLLIAHISKRTSLYINKSNKGKVGDIVMWLDDNSNEHLTRVTKGIRPRNVIGKVESILTKL